MARRPPRLALGRCPDAEAGCEPAIQALQSGAGLRRLRELIEAQGGDPQVTEDIGLLPQPAVTHEVRAGQDAWLEEVDTEAIGHAAAELGAGPRCKDDIIDPAVGIELPTKIGDHVRRDAVIARIFAADQSAASRAADAIQNALAWSSEPVAAPPLIHDLIPARTA